MASIVFYGWGEPKYVPLMLISVLVGYVSGLLIEKYRGKLLSRISMAFGVVLSLSFLVYFKYADFFIDNFNAVTGLSVPLLKIALPVGISFYTFQIVSYIIDVYRNDTSAQKNPIDLAAYISMFPQLIAGPIVRYSDIEKQLVARTVSFDKASLGIRRFVFGLGKKILLANAFGELCSIYRASDEKTVLFAWLYGIAFSLQIYFDFSGYSDMAIGLGHILGFDFLENFNYPYISSSITEFWRRWHISLGTWFKDYVYIPLGGNRLGKLRQFFNIFIVWFLTGFWHGASWNFIVWGLMFAVLLMIEKAGMLKLLKKTKIISHVYVVFLVMISFIIFNAVDMKEAIYDITALFGAHGLPLSNASSVYYMKSYALVYIFAFIGATPLMKWIIGKIRATQTGERIVNICEPIVLIRIFLIVTSYLVDGSFNPFLYYRF